MRYCSSRKLQLVNRVLKVATGSKCCCSLVDRNSECDVIKVKDGFFVEVLQICRLMYFGRISRTKHDSDCLRTALSPPSCYFNHEHFTLLLKLSYTFAFGVDGQSCPVLTLCMFDPMCK